MGQTGQKSESEVEKEITEWERSVEVQLEAMTKCDLDREELRRAMEKAHPGLLDHEIDALMRKLEEDLENVRGSC
jgi:DNA invertase Pin-like site-specific DNA recombinase